MPESKRKIYRALLVAVSGIAYIKLSNALAWPWWKLYPPYLAILLASIFGLEAIFNRIPQK